MATTKTLTPTNQAITLAAFTDKPDNRTNVTNDDRLADAVNTLNSKIRTISTGSLHDITTPGMYWLTSVVADKPEPGAGMYILQAYADNYRAGLYVVADNCVQYNVALVNDTWTYNKLALNSNFKRYSFNGTPDSDGVIITDCPLSTHIPITAYQLNREGWIINFVQNSNKSTSYWCAKISGANASSGNFSAHVAAITKSVLTI